MELKYIRNITYYELNSNYTMPWRNQCYCVDVKLGK